MAGDEVGGSAIVTGAAGFLGSTIVRALAAREIEVHALVAPWSDAWRLEGVPCRIVPADLTDPQQLDAAIGDVITATVIHCASSKDHATTDDEIDLAWRTNLLGTTNLLRTLRRAPEATLVHVGSSTEYAPSDRPLSERSPCEPVTVRGASKLAATVAVRQWARSRGRDAAIVRPFSVYGPRQQPDRLVPTLVRCARTGEPFRMLDGTSRRDLVHVDDVAEGCVRAAKCASTDAPIVNLGTGIEHSVDEVLHLVEELSGRPIVRAAARRPRAGHDVSHWVGDITLAKELLAWHPVTSLRDGIAQLIDAAA